MEDYQNKLKKAPRLGSGDYFISSDTALELKRIDIRISDLILKSNYDSSQLLNHLNKLKGRLNVWLDKSTSKQTSSHGFLPTCDPKTRIIQGKLSSRQSRWLKYFSIGEMTSEEIRVFNSWNHNESTPIANEIDKRLNAIDAISALYSNTSLYEKRGHFITDKNHYTLVNYRDRYSLAHTAVVMSILLQVKLLAEDLLFLLTSLIRSLYFFGLSDKVRVQLITNHCKIQKLLFGESEEIEILKNWVRTKEGAQNEGANCNLADQQLDKIGKEILLRSVGQLGLSLKMIKLIKLRYGEYWQKITDRAKSKAIACAQLEKKRSEGVGEKVYWREQLRRDMTLKMLDLPSSHTHDLNKDHPIFDRYNQLLQQVSELEKIIQTTLFSIDDRSIGSFKGQEEENVKKTAHLDDNGRPHDWANW